jgi:hypothetical protein
MKKELIIRSYASSLYSFLKSRDESVSYKRWSSLVRSSFSDFGVDSDIEKAIFYIAARRDFSAE